MYNGDFVNEEAKHLAARVGGAAGDDVDEQIRIAFELALSRPPTSDESQKFRKFFKTAESPEQTLVGLCRILYNCNEFIYVD